MEPARHFRDAISFGPFTLVPSERLLIRDGSPVELGARALDILVALVLQPNQPVSKSDLIGRVWPDVIVSEGSLRFHIASLRKTLGDGEDGARYITTLAGRGYCFVAPVSRASDQRNAPSAVSASYLRANVPSRAVRMVGRSDSVRMLCTQLVAVRFVTIVGAGGVGKTTVAVAVAHYLIEAFGGVVRFVDLGALSDPNLVAASLAAMLGLSVQSDDAIPGLIAYLRDKRILLVLDTCEHLIGSVADLASRIFLAAPQLHILATSREALRVEGEHVHRLAPLACPPDVPNLTASAALTFPAVQLFVERAAASGAPLNLSDSDAAIVASICRKLDGLALAIELAAARVETYGLEQTAALLDERLALLWQGQRTAPPRQQTLKAMLDWSYERLTRLERQVLRQLAIFVGDFPLGAALAVLTSASLDQIHVLGALENLVAKSMVATTHTGATMRYRLLDTTRAYALEIDIDAAEFADLAVRHATYYRRWLEQIAAEWSTFSNPAERVPHLASLANVRAGLEWCFGADGNAAIGIGLASAAAPVFLAMSLLTECHRWAERAIRALDDTTRGRNEEMHLQAALGVSLMFTRGGNDAARVALNRSFAIAEARGNSFDQLQALGPLEMFHIRTGEFKTALHYAKRCSDIAGKLPDPTAVTSAHSLMGISLHLAGELDSARLELEAALQDPTGSHSTSTIYLGFESQVLAGAVLASTLWLQGYPVQAVERARQTVKEAASLDHPLTLSLALIWAIYVFFWTGDLRSAQEHIERLIAYAGSYSLGPYLAVGRGFKGELAIRRDDPHGGIESLQDTLMEFHATPYEVQSTPFNTSLVQGLAAIGRFSDGIALIDETIREVESNGDCCYMPEVLRVKGALLLSMPEPSCDEAEICFLRSLEWSRIQGARAWELRTAVDLAALLAARGQSENARALLQPVFDQFVEGLDTADLQSAQRLLVSLG